MDALLQNLKAVAEDTRLRILALCGQTELSVSELTSILNQSQPRVSRHLKLLVEAGLLDRFREGQWAFYRASEKDLPNGFAPALLALIPFDDPVFERDRARLEMVRQGTRESGSVFQGKCGGMDGIRRLSRRRRIRRRGVTGALAGPTRLGTFLRYRNWTGRILKDYFSEGETRCRNRPLLEMLTVARSTLAGPSLPTVVCDTATCNNFPLDDDSFDVVTFHLVLHYAERPELAFFGSNPPAASRRQGYRRGLRPTRRVASKDRARASVARFYGQRNAQLVRSRRIGSGRHYSLGRQSAHGLYMVRHKAGERSRFGEYSKR